MRANQHARKKMADDRGEVGIGTMIVFIAAVIVAAVAAAVLINTAGNLERKASETGKETTEEVSANIFIRDIIGFANATGEGMDRVAWYIALAPGSEPIDLNLTVIQWNDGSTLADVPASSLACDDAAFDALTDGFCVRHVFDTGDNNRYVVSPGDRVRVEVQLGPGEHVEMRKTIRVLFLPEVGSPVEATFSTPSTFGNQNQVSLK